MAKKTLAYGYVRVSGKGQVKGHGPRRQRDDIQAFADANGYEIVHVYQDAYTGTESDRPKFIEMLAAMMANGVKVVIVECLDRFSRDLMVQSTMLAKLSTEGLTLIAANTGENVTAAIQADPMRRAMVQIQGVFAELDKSLTVPKLRKAREDKREKTGRCEGVKRFGYFEGEPEVIERMRELRRKPRGGKRRSFADMAAILNEEGHPTRHGGPWTRGAVHKILSRV